MSETECVICNVELPVLKTRGRPSKTCSVECRAQYRKVREARPERVLHRHAYETKRAREGAGLPTVMDCRMCHQPVDASVRGPKGDLETGFDLHEARGTDDTDVYPNCKEAYVAMRRAQRLQTNRRVQR